MVADDPTPLSRQCLREELIVFAETELRALFASELRNIFGGWELEEQTVQPHEPELVKPDDPKEDAVPVIDYSPASTFNEVRMSFPQRSCRENSAEMALSTLDDEEDALRRKRVHDEMDKLGVLDELTRKGRFARVWDSVVEATAKLEARADRGAASWPCIKRLEAFESRGLFNGAYALVVLINAFLLAHAADSRMKNVESPPPRFFMQVEVAFLIGYTAEMLVRLVARRVRFFYSGWGWFDAVIVVGGVTELVASLGHDSNMAHVSLTRMLRMLKLLRVVRLMRSVHEVRLLLDSLMSSMRPLMWTIVLIGGTIFMFGVIMVNGVSSYLREEAQRGHSGVDASEVDLLKQYFGSLAEAMYTLFGCATGGRDWQDVADTLRTVGTSYFLIFVIYMVLFAYVVSNSVCAIFLEAHSTYALRDRRRILQEQLARKKEYMGMIVQIYDGLDADHSGMVDQAEFEALMGDSRMSAFAQALEIDMMDLGHFFEVMSQKGTKAVGLEAFVEACIRLRGHARSMDVIEISMNQHFIHQDLLRIQHELYELRSVRKHTISMQGLARSDTAPSVCAPEVKVSTLVPL